MDLLTIDAFIQVGQRQNEGRIIIIIIKNFLVISKLDWQSENVDENSLLLTRDCIEPVN
jgi:hypothetical protein